MRPNKRIPYLDPPSGTLEGAFLLISTIILLVMVFTYDIYTGIFGIGFWIIGGRIGKLIGEGKWKT